MSLAKFREKVTECFDVGELRTLCFDLSIDYESLGDGGKANRVRELIAYCRRHGCIPELLKELSQLRPSVPWNDLATIPEITPGQRLGRGAAAVLPLVLLVLIATVFRSWVVQGGRELLYALGIVETATPVAVSVLTPKPTPAGGTSTPSHMPTMTPTPTLIPTCPYQADNDKDTIRRLVHAESEAVKRKDISIIKAIFAEHAIIQDGANSEQKWNDPVVRYETLFAETTFTEAIHFEAQPVGDGITVTIAWFTSGSKGEYVTGDGHSGSYDNPACSDHWTFEKNRSGCWVITRFTFNACLIPFPP
jgi:hypothetical protein